MRTLDAKSSSRSGSDQGCSPAKRQQKIAVAANSVETTMHPQRSLNQIDSIALNKSRPIRPY